MTTRDNTGTARKVPKTPERASLRRSGQFGDSAEQKDSKKPDCLSRALCAKLLICVEILAEWTGLEPATPGVTGRYSNQLNYHSW